MEENQDQPVADAAKKGVGMWVVLGIVGLVVVVGGVYLLMTQKTNPNSQIQNPSIEETTIVSSPVPTEGVVMEEGGAVRGFVVEGSPFKFVPAEIRVKKGDTVRVTFKNLQGTHDFVIDELDVRTNQIGEGEEEEVEFVADKARTFEYYCSVGNHRAQGMVGKLVVE